MSIDLFVYSTRERPLTRTELGRETAHRGVFALFVDPEMKLKSDGELDDEWMLASRDERVIQLLTTSLQKGDKDTYKTLYKKCQVGSFGLSVERANGFRDGAQEEENPEARDYLLVARTLYHLNYRGSASTYSSSLANEVWKLLAALLEGLAEDPQTGVQSLFTGGAERCIRDWNPEEAPFDLGKLIAAGRKAGLPVDEQGIHTERMSVDDLRRTVELASDVLEPFAALPLAAMIFEEFEWKRGSGLSALDRKKFETLKSQFLK